MTLEVGDILTRTHYNFENVKIIGVGSHYIHMTDGISTYYVSIDKIDTYFVKAQPGATVDAPNSLHEHLTGHIERDESGNIKQTTKDK